MSTFMTLAWVAAPPVHGGGPYGGDGPPFPFFVIPIFWLLLLGGIALAVILGRRRRDRVSAERAGERVLAERFAAGEIDDSEYRTRRAVLREKR